MNGLVVKQNSILEPMTVFNLEERRLFTFCLQHYDSRPDAANPRLFEAPIEAFKEAYPELTKRRPAYVFQVCVDAINGLQQKPYRPDPTKKKVVWWFDMLEITDDGMIKFSLTSSIMPYFLGIREKFIEYHMKDVEMLKKPTAWSLYEYLKEKFMNGVCPSWSVEVVDLKDRLGVINKYKRFGDFDTRCLKQPVLEINKHSDLTVSYKKKKRGVRIQAIIFNVKLKASDPDVIDIEDLSKIFAQEQSRYGLGKIVVERNVEQAEKSGLTPKAIETIPNCRASWKKHGKGPFTPYLARTLSNLLFEQPLPGFGMTDDEKRESLEILKTLPNKDLYDMVKNGNAPAKDVLKNRAAAGDSEAKQLL